MSCQNVLLPNEVEAYVKELCTSDLTAVGSPKWLKQHKLVYKLSVQAILSAKNEDDEYMKDFFVSFEKAPVLIHELLLMEVWKENVLPEILKFDISLSSHVPLYFVLYHESNIVSLLGALLFHEEIVESANDLLIDLIDYCHRKLVLLLSREELKECNSHAAIKEDGIEGLLEKEKILSFFTEISAISLLTNVTRHLNVVPLSALHRILSIHDIPMIFVNLLHEKSWQRRTPAGDVENYTNGVWTRAADEGKLHDIEGQIWVSLLQLLHNSSCIQKYEITDFRKGQLLKLRSKITEAAINQIPALEGLLHFLEELNMHEPAPAKPTLIIEQVPEIREGLLAKHSKAWKSIAQEQVAKYFATGEPAFNSLCKGLSGIYDMESLEVICPGAPKCAQCFGKGDKKCSRCKNEWYCGRKCQVEHWSKHKPLCDAHAVK